jgi:hypothetical protein
MFEAHIAPFYVSRGPDSSQNHQYNVKNLVLAGRMLPTGRMLPLPGLNEEIKDW